MTFIASVIAKDGIAVVADSLVSSFTETLERVDWEDFIEKNRAVAKKKNGFSFSEEEITQLFQTKPSHTKDFENKLFEYDDYTLISTAGSAIINNKRIVNLVAEIKKKTQKNKRSYRQQGIVRKIEEFCEILHQEVSAHMNEHGSIGETTFIFSHFDKNSLTPHVFKVSVKPSSDINSVSINTNTVKELIVCDGQPGIAYRILYGGIIEGLEIKNLILDSLKQELGKNGIVEGKQLPNGFFKSLDETQTLQIINSQI
ncbi:MAG: hypothetical protein IM638_01320 [Bacteroidetes bacterium]|nr:hypothetical protein [Bacteroidota bacterium]